MLLLSYKRHLQYIQKKTYLQYLALPSLLTIRNNYLLWLTQFVTKGLTIQCNYLINYRKKKRNQQTKKKTSQQITKGNALNGEKEIPFLLKFPFTIQRGSNIIFYLDFILH